MIDIQEIPSAHWQSPDTTISKEDYITLIKNAEQANEDPTTVIVPTAATKNELQDNITISQALER